MTILFTGFEAFGSRKTNNSWEIVKSFKDRVGIEVLLLPVSFSRAHKIAIDHICKRYYDLIIMVGENSHNTDYLKLERVAINLKDSISSDKDGEVANETQLCPNGSKAYFTNFNIKESADCLKKLGYKVKVSNSAGTYVCNSLYYNVLHYINTNNLQSEALFIHVPASNEVLTIEEMRNSINALLHHYVTEIKHMDIF